ncbi:ubiquitin-like protein 7 [Pipistrellus kuhlii]|uniref:ubiquitin-like protein 7 n=1 Tax=Pipistrellus kuhlii TaxID=59472 RepID=UPI00174EEF5D|nr:ubiquitin-like protein 7 [Pipistrellus kuhlii]
MSLSDWHLAVKLADQPLAPKSILRLPETELGEYSLGGYSISFLKQLIAGKLQESVPDPELIDLIYCGRKLKDDQTLDFYGIQPGSTIHVLRKSWPEPDQKPEPVDKVAALREFRVLHTALQSSSSYREEVFKMLSNKESLDQIIVATPGLSSDPIALGVLQDKDLFSVFADPNMLDTLVPAHPALVNAIVLVLHSVAGSTPLPGADSSSRSTPSSSYRDMPGGFLFEGLSDDEDDFHPRARSMPSSSAPALAQLPWGTVELPDPDPSPRVSWPLHWPWPALQRAALTRRLLAPRAILPGPHQCPLVSSRGRPSPMISSAKPYSMPCRPLGSPTFRASGSPSCSSCTTWAFRMMS